MNHIGIKIKARREELGMTQEELAEKLGYKSKSTINKIEMGINDITQSKIIAFAKALDTTASLLMGWEEIGNIEVTNVEKSKNEQLKRLIAYYNNMNDIGRKKALDNAEDLSKIYGVDYIYDDGKNNFVIEVKGNNSLKAAHNDNETNQEEIENMNQDLDELND